VSPLDLVEGTVITTLLTGLAACRIVGEKTHATLVKRGPKGLVGVQETVTPNARRAVTAAHTTAVHREAAVGDTVAPKARLVALGVSGKKADAASVNL
jgi:hypothetical protein